MEAGIFNEFLFPIGGNAQKSIGIDPSHVQSMEPIIRFQYFMCTLRISIITLENIGASEKNLSI